ncbi:MAG TPA: TolC family protein [Sedimentisphaerales bacterium]|jgi:outer membrane protein|nr:TolC family protein [Sedimentisphaerales bacterium]HNU27969.1 TolC family protein [Sedimentisphaerales bacterium]
MSRYPVPRGIRLTVAVWLAVVLLGGCHLRTPDYDKALMADVREKVHQIEPLELQQAEPNKTSPEPSEPPAEIELSLEQCRALALENNLQLKASLINPSIAAARLSEEEAAFESAFFANASLTKTDLPFGGSAEVGETGVRVPIVATSQTETVAVDTGVRVPLRTGGTVTFDLGDSRTRDLNREGPFNPSYEDSLSVSISQPLLRGAGKWVNTHSIRLAAYNHGIVSAQTKLDIITVLAAIDRVYWRLYAARRVLEVRQQQYELAMAQLERARRLVDAGQRSQIEVIRAESGVAQQLEAIIVAENTLRDRQREIKRVIRKPGLDMRTPTIVVPCTMPDPVRYKLEEGSLVKQAMESRMELLELQLQILQDASVVDSARNLTLPSASLVYSYNINATGQTRNESFDMLSDSDFVNHRLGLQLLVPIGNQAAKSRLRQAIYQRRRDLATRANREMVIQQEVLNAVDQVEANWQRILAARQNTIVNARLYEAEKRAFDVDMSTSTDVLDAQSNFADAQTSEIQALADYQISLVEVAYATGTILGAARIQWESIVPADDAD